jgi:general secretion pathway protein D
MTEVLRQAAHDGALSTPGLFEVKADERSNALLVTAAPGDMERVREIIAQLDVTLAQVLVEAAIIQIPVERRTHTQGPKAGAFPWELAALGTNIAGLVLLPGSTDDSQPKEQEGLRYLARLGVDLDTAVNMFATSRSVTNARILQRPRVQTSVGVPATLFVGQQVPYPVGSYTCGCPPARVDPGIGVAFETTPQLAPGGIVLLDVKQKVDMIITNVIIQNVGNVPVTASTTSEARLAVHDRETVLFGGVSVTNRISIFPEITGLNNVPIVGAALNRLIRAPKRTERVELLVLLRTTVLPTPEVAAQGQRAQKERMPAAAGRL